jgi:hypothetical protein
MDMEPNSSARHTARRPLENLVQRSQPSTPGSYDFARLPSNSIRLLRLSRKGSDLHGELTIVHLASRTKYAAASYHWGQEYEGEIKFPDNRSLPLSRNLYLALQGLTSNPEVKLPLLWIDQICINQRDLDEREDQVGIMSEIYSGAVEVMVWLGSESEIENFAELAWAVEHLCKYSGKHTMAQIQRSLVNHGGAKAEQGFRGLLSLWLRPWFERLWVRQEVALAKQVTFHCGPDKFALKELARACKIQLDAADDVLSVEFRDEFSELARVTAKSCAQVARAHELFELVEVTAPRGVYKRQNLLDILRYTFDLKTEKSHDRVYAIYHLSSAAFYQKFWPSYKKRIEKLWQELAAYLLNDHTTWNNFRTAQTTAANSRSSDNELHVACPAVILALSSTQENARRRRVLSWVPQFDKFGLRSAHKFDTYVDYSHCFAAGGKEEFKPIVSLEGQPTLRIEGVILSTVCTIKDATQQPSLGDAPYEFGSDEYWKFVRTKLVPWYVRCHGYAGEPQLPHSHDFGTLLRQGIDERWKYGKRVGVSNLKTFLEKAANTGSVPAGYRKGTRAEGMYTDLLPFIARDAWRIDARDHRRILAVLSDVGRKGWVPESTECGDSVILIKGAPFPFVVREVEPGTHNVVGDAYFDGLQEDRCWRGCQDRVRVFNFR